MSSLDKAGKEYWNATEHNSALAPPFVHDGHGIRHHARRELDAYLSRHLGGIARGSTLLELGAGGSAMLPYFHRRFGFRVSGIDYSEQGCRLAERMCARENVPVEAVCADIFAPPPAMSAAYDVVVSFGVAEHFADTAAAITAFTYFLKPGGVMLTSTPNMAGLVGAFQKLIARDIYDHHVAFDRDALRRAHVAAGLDIVASDYLMFMNFGVVNPGQNAGMARQALFQGLRALTVLAWSAEQLIALPDNSVTSPYILCVARRPMHG